MERRFESEFDRRAGVPHALILRSPSRASRWRPRVLHQPVTGPPTAQPLFGVGRPGEWLPKVDLPETGFQFSLASGAVMAAVLARWRR